MNNNSQFTFYSHPDSLTSHVQDGPSSRKRKSSYEDISPLVMKTRAGVGLEQEIVYDRTMTMMMRGQRKLLEEQRQRLPQEQLYQTQDPQMYIQQQQQQQAPSQHKESSAEAMRRLFMFGKSQSPVQHSQSSPIPQQAPNQSLWTFSDCVGEINGCETNRVPGMRDRYQAVIRPCTFCQRPQCQFCTVNCASCQELSCRACCIASYERSDVEYYCHMCRG